MSLPLCLFRVSGQTRIRRRSFDQLEGRPLEALCAAIPSADERERLQIALRRAPDARVRSVVDKSSFVEATIAFTRTTHVMGELIEVPVEYRVLFRKNAAVLAVAGTSIALAEAFARAAQCAAGGDGLALDRIDFDRPFLQQLAKWLLLRSHAVPGSLLRARFVNASLDGDGPFEEVSLASSTLLESKTFASLAKKCGDPTFITFIAPVFEGVSRPLTCSFNFRGLIRVLTQETTLDEATRLVGEMESLLPG
jgi:hypothetical protein